MENNLNKIFKRGREAGVYAKEMEKQGYRVTRTTACKGGLRDHFVIVNKRKQVA